MGRLEPLVPAASEEESNSKGKPFAFSLGPFANTSSSPSIMFGSSVEEAKASSGRQRRASCVGFNHSSAAIPMAQPASQPVQPAVGYFPDAPYYGYPQYSSMYSDYQSMGVAPGMQVTAQNQTEQSTAQNSNSEAFAAEASNGYMSYQVVALPFRDA